MKNNKKLNSFWLVLSKICLIPSTILILIGIILFIATDGNFAVLIQSPVWFILSICFYIAAKTGDNKIVKLKCSGICYDAEIVDVMPNMMVSSMFRAGGIASCIKCRYQNAENKTYLVKSRLYWFTRFDLQKESFSAKVYVNSINPKDYCIEIQNNDKILNVDYDYT